MKTMEECEKSQAILISQLDEIVDSINGGRYIKALDQLNGFLKKTDGSASPPTRLITTIG